jgi:hypothetical protein
VPADSKGQASHYPASVRQSGLKQLDLKGTHPELGQVTLRQLLATWATHDLGHLGQIVRVMAKQYGSEVGPWKEFISILKR